jgi:hypothetical protein
MLQIKVRATNIVWKTDQLDMDQNNDPIGVPACAMDIIVYADDEGAWGNDSFRIVATELQNETGVDVLDFEFEMVSSEPFDA